MYIFIVCTSVYLITVICDCLKKGWLEHGGRNSLFSLFLNELIYFSPGNNNLTGTKVRRHCQVAG